MIRSCLSNGHRQILAAHDRATYQRAQPESALGVDHDPLAGHTCAGHSAIGKDVEAEAKAAAARIEHDFPNERLFRIAANGGFDESAVSPETPLHRSKDGEP